jgi:uncharacterized phage protein (TIGR01671 family)
MTRDIKFRAWDKINSKMYTDKVEAMSFAKSGTPANVSIGGFSQPLIAIGDDPQLMLMQYTGLHDKNGKEIYEGDIVEFEQWRDDKQYYTARQLVQFDLGMFQIYGEPLRNYQNIAVIGNINENPELLK